MRRIARLLLPALLALLLTPAVWAGDESAWPLIPQGADATPLASESAGCSDCGTWSVQVMTGYYPMSSLGPGSTPFGVSSSGRDRVDYLPVSLRAGYEFPKLFSPDTCLQGRLQALLEYDTLIVSKAFGHYFTGPSALLRYKFVQPEALLQPYVQLGAGLVFDDAYREQGQRLIGRWQEFLLQAEVGVRFLLTDSVSLDVEGGIQHISNAGLAARNGGINNLGVTVGLTYTFGSQ